MAAILRGPGLDNPPGRQPIIRATRTGTSAVSQLLQETVTASISHLIQLSVAPVFLLSGVGALLNVFTNRLARIVDRARQREAEFPTASPNRLPFLREALAGLALRARLMSWAISLCTGCALLVCVVIVVLFLDTFFEVNLGPAIAIGFVLAMLCLIAALMCFLHEVFVATKALRIGIIESEQESGKPR